MALTFQGVSKSDILSGVVAKIEIATQAGSPSYQDVGLFEPPQISIEDLSMPSDPSGSPLVYALRFSFSFTIVQTKKTAELAAMAGTSGTGLYETDVQIKFTMIDGRTWTLGSVTTYPMSVNASYSSGTEADAQKIAISSSTIEPITSVAAKVS